MCTYKKARETRQHTIYCNCVPTQVAHNVLSSEAASAVEPQLMCMNRAQKAKKVARQRPGKGEAPIGTPAHGTPHLEKARTAFLLV